MIRSTKIPTLALLGLAALGGFTTAAAQTQAGNIVTLRSPAFHGGAHPWTMRRAKDAGGGAALSQAGYDTAAWRNAIVPGTVLYSLVADGVYPEPYYGLNNAHELNLIPDLSTAGRDFYTYWFRTEFTMPAEFSGKQIWLQFEGVNQKAEIWLNGQRLGELAGMFQRGVFNTTALAKLEGPNALAVLVHPVEVPGGFKQKIKVVRAAGENKNGGDGEIGRNTTMPMTVGWDFTFTDGIRDRNTGNWSSPNRNCGGPSTRARHFCIT